MEKMEKTVLNIKTDAKLKRNAQDIARKLGLPLGTIMNAYLRELVQEQRITFSIHPEPNTTTRKVLDKALSDLHSEKKSSFSPVFDDADDAIVWLEK